MKTRMIYTRIWNDEWFENLLVFEKLLFIYLLTNPHINLIGIFELSDRAIRFETGLTEEQLRKSKSDLKSRIMFHKGWVIIKNVDKYDMFKGAKLLKAREIQLKEIPNEIKAVSKGFRDTLSIPYRYSMDTPNSNSNSNRSINKNNNILVKSEKPFTEKLPKRDELGSITEKVLDDLAEKYQVPLSFIRSKHDDLINWVEEMPERAKGRDLCKTLDIWVKKDSMKIRKEEHGRSKIAIIPD